MKTPLIPFFSSFLGSHFFRGYLQVRPVLALFLTCACVHRTHAWGFVCITVTSSSIASETNCSLCKADWWL